MKVHSLLSNIIRPSLVVDRLICSGFVLRKKSHALRRKIDGTMASIEANTLSASVTERRVFPATVGSKILRSFLDRLILTNVGNATLARDNVSITSDGILTLQTFLEVTAEFVGASTAATLKTMAASLSSLISNWFSIDLIRRCSLSDRHARGVAN